MLDDGYLLIQSTKSEQTALNVSKLSLPFLSLCLLFIQFISLFNTGNDLKLWKSRFYCWKICLEKEDFKFSTNQFLTSRSLARSNSQHQDWIEILTIIPLNTRKENLTQDFHRINVDDISTSSLLSSNNISINVGHCHRLYHFSAPVQVIHPFSPSPLSPQTDQ